MSAVVGVSLHAAQRWAERVKGNPDMSTAAAVAEVEGCAALSEHVPCALPAWAGPRDVDYEGHFLVAENIAIVTRPTPSGRPLAVTVLTRDMTELAQRARIRRARPPKGRRRPPRGRDDRRAREDAPRAT